MGDRIRVVGCVIINNNVRPGERAKRKRLNEFTCMPRHRHPHITARALQFPKHFDGFVGSNAAANPEGNTFPLPRFLRIISHCVKAKCNTAELTVQYWLKWDARIIRCDQTKELAYLSSLG